MKKRFLAAMIILIFVLGVIAGCNSGGDIDNINDEDINGEDSINSPQSDEIDDIQAAASTQSSIDKEILGVWENKAYYLSAYAFFADGTFAYIGSHSRGDLDTYAIYDNVVRIRYELYTYSITGNKLTLKDYFGDEEYIYTKVQ